ncbi:unnamed protein product, partial [Aureobasidium uvarum]
MAAIHKTNPSLQVTADHQIKMAEAPIEKPGYGEVLLHIKCTGICGSDIHFWKTGRIGPLIVESDCVLGHEASGVVLKLGEGVKDFVVEWQSNPACPVTTAGSAEKDDTTFAKTSSSPACGLTTAPSSASKCMLQNGCTNQNPRHGQFRRRRTPRTPLRRPPRHPSRRPHPRPRRRDLRRRPHRPNRSPLFPRLWRTPLVITDLEPQRLAFAKKLVPECETYQVSRDLSSEDNAKGIRRLFGESEYGCPETVLECTGVESSIVTAAFAVRRGGTVMVIGVGRPVVNNIPFMHMSLGEINLKFINRYTDTWPAGIAAVKGKLMDLKPLVSHVFPLEKAVDAMHICADLSQGSIKVQIVDDVEIKPEDVE